MALMPAGILVGRTSLPGAEFADHPAYGLAQLRGDLERLAFLLSGSDGDQLFGPASP